MPKKLKSHLLFTLLLLSSFSFLATVISFGQGEYKQALITAFFAIWTMLLSILTKVVVEGRE